MTTEREIQALVDRETAAWDRQDPEELLSLVDGNLWRRRSDLTPLFWKGRACKGYTKVGDSWLLIFHTGLLDYDA